MKNFHVIITSLVNPTKDFDNEYPQTKDYEFDIDATCGEDALEKAIVLHSNLTCGKSIQSKEIYRNL